MTLILKEFLGSVSQNCVSACARVREREKATKKSKITVKGPNSRRERRKKVQAFGKEKSANVASARKRTHTKKVAFANCLLFAKREDRLILFPCMPQFGRILQSSSAAFAVLKAF